MTELTGLEARALRPARTRKQAIAEANRRRAGLGEPLLSSSTVSDWFKRGTPARDFANMWSLIEVLLEWAESPTRTAQRDPAVVRQVQQRRWWLVWESARAEQVSTQPRPHTRPAPVTVAPLRLAQTLLSTYIDRSIDITDMLGGALTGVSRSENRDGWELLSPVPLQWAESSWPIRHHGHVAGFLKWVRDEDGHDGWELAVPDGRWEAEDEDAIHGLPVRHWPYRYLAPPPALCAGGKRGWWADPADALLTHASWHYCPHAALSTLFQLVDEGVSADEASDVVHIVPAVGEHLVRRAQENRGRSGQPLLVQVDDFLPVQEADWDVGLV